MSLKDKIVAGTVAISVVAGGGVAVNELDKACVFDAEVIEVQQENLSEASVLKTWKANKKGVCFKTKEDYKTMRDLYLAEYRNSKDGLFFYTADGQDFLLFLNHESSKRGSLTFRNFKGSKPLSEPIIP